MAEATRRTLGRLILPFCEAAAKGDTAAVRGYLAQGVPLNKGFTCEPLICAASAGHTAIVRLLLEHGARADYRDGHGQNALRRAVQNGHTEAALLLWEAYRRQGTPEEADAVALLGAVQWGQVDTVRALLAAGVNVNVRDESGWTALETASNMGFVHIAGLLKRAGARG